MTPQNPICAIKFLFAWLDNLDYANSMSEYHSVYGLLSIEFVRILC